MSNHMTTEQRIAAHRAKLLKKQGLPPTQAPPAGAPVSVSTDSPPPETTPPDTPTLPTGTPTLPPVPFGPPTPPPPATPSTAFRDWLRTPQGQDAADPRFPYDSVRRAVMLEDALEKAFVAGYNRALQ